MKGLSTAGWFALVLWIPMSVVISFAFDDDVLLDNELTVDQERSFEKLCELKGYEEFTGDVSSNMFKCVKHDGESKSTGWFLITDSTEESSVSSDFSDISTVFD